MTATGHAVIGTVIAATITNPFIAAPIALFSHIPADLFPHWDSGTHVDKKTKKRFLFEAIFDVLMGFVVSYLLITFVFPKTDLSYAFLMVIIAEALDFAWAPYFFLNWKFPPFDWLFKVSEKFNSTLDKPWGIINQIAVLVLLVVVAKLYFY